MTFGTLEIERYSPRRYETEAVELVAAALGEGWHVDDGYKPVLVGDGVALICKVSGSRYGNPNLFFRVERDWKHNDSIRLDVGPAKVAAWIRRKIVPLHKEMERRHNARIAKEEADDAAAAARLATAINGHDLILGPGKSRYGGDDETARSIKSGKTTGRIESGYDAGKVDVTVSVTPELANKLLKLIAEHVID